MSGRQLDKQIRVQAGEVNLGVTVYEWHLKSWG